MLSVIADGTRNVDALMTKTVVLVMVTITYTKLGKFSTSKTNNSNALGFTLMPMSRLLLYL